MRALKNIKLCFTLLLVFWVSLCCSVDSANIRAKNSEEKRSNTLSPISKFKQARSLHEPIIFEPVEFTSQDLLEENVEIIGYSNIPFSTQQLPIYRYELKDRIHFGIVAKLQHLGYTDFDEVELYYLIKEAVKNAAEHGNLFSEEKKVIVKAKIVNHTLILSIEDEGGIIFDFKNYANVRLDKRILRAIKGSRFIFYALFSAFFLDKENDDKLLLSGQSVGIYQLARYFDSINYSFEAGKRTSLILEKYLGPPLKIKANPPVPIFKMVGNFFKKNSSLTVAAAA